MATTANAELDADQSGDYDCETWQCGKYATTELYFTRPAHIVEQCDWIDGRVGTRAVCEGCLKRLLSDPDSMYRGERTE